MNGRRAAVLVCAVLGLAVPVSLLIGDRVDRLVGTVRLDHALSDAIPNELAGWVGTDDPLPDEVRRTTKVDDHVRRRYRGPNGEAALLYVAYHGNKARGMQTYYHNPTICFPAAGFTLVDTRPGSETLPDAAKEVPVCRYVFAREGARLSVLTFFRVNGELLDQSPRNKPIWMLFDSVKPQFDDSPGTFVQVQVVVSVAGTDDWAAAEVQTRFLRDFGRAILAATDAGTAR